MTAPPAPTIIWQPQPGPQTELLRCPVFEVCLGGSRGGGKRLHIDTPVPVPLETHPSGFKTMGTLEAGDFVMSPRGEPVRVTWCSPILPAPDTLAVQFDTGETILADAEHLWRTMSHDERRKSGRRTEAYRAARRAKRPSRAKAISKAPWVSARMQIANREKTYQYLDPPAGGVRTTDEIARTLLVNGDEINHSVEITKPIELPEQDLPIEPYLFGVWLGDGLSRCGRIGMSVTDFEAVLVYLPPPAMRVFDPRPMYRGQFLICRFDGLTTQLRQLGVLHAKRIPPRYLRSSQGQRLALLQGLMDTDGYCCKRGFAEIGFSNRNLIDDTIDLLSSLGVKATVTEKIAHCNGKPAGLTWRIKFCAPFPAFRLPRKAERQKLSGFRSTVTRRFITAVRPAPSVPMRCIKVDHDDGMYLVGRTMIATHNTDAMLGEWAQHAHLYGKDAIGRFFRRERTQLVEAMNRAKEIYIPIGAKWREVEKEFVFPNGARLVFAYLERDADAEAYQGFSMTRLYFEELTNFADPGPVNKLKATLRSAAGVPCGFRSTCNPGGPGHQWVKSRYIDPSPQGFKVIVEGGLDRVFIPARLTDNPKLVRNDPGYVDRLKASGSAQLVRAWLEGDWDIVEGAYFDCWSSERHVVRPVELPRHWTRFTSFDWGSFRPFSVGWYAVSDGEMAQFPKGALIRYREWYGCSAPNVGLKMQSPDIAKGILEREGKDERIVYRVADPACWKAEDGPSVAERMAQSGVRMNPGDNSRVMGWEQVRSRLLGEDDRPMLYVFSTGAHLIRTLPALQHDEHRPEDVDSDMEDHAPDELRLACMSRPYVKTMPAPQQADDYKRHKRFRRPKASGWAA